jgi:hypothetical protein
MKFEGRGLYSTGRMGIVMNINQLVKGTKMALGLVDGFQLLLFAFWDQQALHCTALQRSWWYEAWS